MAIYRLKSKLYGEFDDDKKKNGIFGTGISAGQALLVGTTALAGRGIYRNMAFKGKIGGVGSDAHIKEIARRKATASKTSNWYNPFSWGNKGNYRDILKQEKAANTAIIKGHDPVTAANQLRERMTVRADVKHANNLFGEYSGLNPALSKGKTTAIRNASTQHLWS